MSFNWEDYVHLSQDLINLDGNKESYVRTSISRAYYGVFCIARDKAGLKTLKSTNAHKTVITTYKNSLDRSKKLVGQRLDKLRKSRNKADYNGDIKLHLTDAQRTNHDAHYVLKLL